MADGARVDRFWLLPQSFLHVFPSWMYVRRWGCARPSGLAVSDAYRPTYVLPVTRSSPSRGDQVLSISPMITRSGCRAVAQPPFKSPPTIIGHGSITQTITIMKKLSTRRKAPKRARTVQLPENGFDHPFWDSRGRHVGYLGKEHPRTVSVGSSGAVGFRHRSTRSSNCGCARSQIILEKDLTGGRRQKTRRSSSNGETIFCGNRKRATSSHRGS